MAVASGVSAGDSTVGIGVVCAGVEGTVSVPFGIIKTMPMLRRFGLARLLARMSATVVVWKRRAILLKVSPCTTVYVCGVGVLLSCAETAVVSSNNPNRRQQLIRLIMLFIR